MKTRGFTLIELMIVIVIIGILVSISVPNFIRMQTNAKEAGVKSNSHAVQVAAEDFGVQNDGVYAADLTDVTPGGDSIIDMLPHDQRLVNPFSKVRSEPVDGAAATPGETGYQPVVDGAGINIGYIVTGQGKNNQVCRYSNGQ